MSVATPRLEGAESSVSLATNVSTPLPSGARSYSVPAVLSSGQTLQAVKSYVLGVNLIKLRPPFTGADFVATNRTAVILDRSLSFFEFALLPSSTQ